MSITASAAEPETENNDDQEFFRLRHSPRGNDTMAEITYSYDAPVSALEFIEVLNRSTLGARRPIDDVACVQGMLDHANLFVTARAGNVLVGVARSVTDFHFCCYLSDLAVDEHYQRHGIGKELIRRTQSRLGPKCTLILLSAPAAVDYYPHIGFERHPQAWILRPGMPLR